MSIVWALGGAAFAFVIVALLVIKVVQLVADSDRVKSIKLKAGDLRHGNLLALELETHDPPPVVFVAVHEPRAMWFIGR